MEIHTFSLKYRTLFLNINNTDIRFYHVYDGWNKKNVDVTTGNLKILIIVVFICQTNRYSYYDPNKPQAVTAISHPGSVITSFCCYTV